MIKSTGKKTWPGKIWLLISMIALFSLGCSLYIGGPQVIPPPDVKTGDLILDTSSFPPGWELSSCEPYCDPEIYSSNKSFILQGVSGHVIQQVIYLGNERDTKAKYKRSRQADFDESEVRRPSTEFLPPSEITYRSPIADEQYLGCGVDVVPACRAIRRYQEYYVYFYFSLDSWYADGELIKTTGLTIEQVEPILRAMDQRVSEKFGIPLQIDEQ